MFNMTRRKGGGGEPAEYGLADVSYNESNWSCTVSNNAFSGFTAPQSTYRTFAFKKPIILDTNDVLTFTLKKTGGTTSYSAVWILGYPQILILSDNFAPSTGGSTWTYTHTDNAPLTLAGIRLGPRNTGSYNNAAYSLAVKVNDETLFSSL